MSRRPSSDLDFVNRAVGLGDDAGEVGYHPRLFCQLALPYKDPGQPAFWQRRNGDFTLTVRPAIEMDPTGNPRVGYPFGTIPRLLLSWLATEVGRQRDPNPEIVLGENLSDFMRQLGMTVTGGSAGSITRLRRQINRLFDASITAQYHGDSRRDVGRNFGIAATKDLWWSDSDRNADQGSLMPSTVRLSNEFFQELVDHPVPVSLDALRLLQSSPQRLDIYTWLTHRASYAKSTSRITWEQLRAQFGSNTADTRQGRSKFREQFASNLRYVLTVYPDARIDVATEGVVVSPSRTHVPQRPSRRALPPTT